jgi:glycosyltransferase involved in cell wall biosynthesis
MRLFLDVTRLRQRTRRSTPSGIDRVEYAYLDHALERLDARWVDFVAFSGLGGGLIKGDRALALRDAVASAWRLDRSCGEDEAFGVLKAELERPVALDAVTCARVEASAQAGEDPAAFGARDLLRARSRLRRRLTAAGDRAVYLHTSHTQLERAALPRWLSATAVPAVFFLHDIIPIDTPEYCRPGEDARHRLRLSAMASHGRLLLVNSQATADAAQAQIEREGWRAPPFAVVPLGVEPCFRTPAALEPLRPERPYCVVVGTIEPRKNLAFLLALWRRLARRHGAGTPRLVIVGRRGWENEGVLDYLERSRLIAPFVTEASDLSDVGVASIMAGAALVLAPSMSEGFNLTVVEALTLGRPVAASDIAAHREVAQGHARLIDPHDGPRWLEAIEAACGLEGAAAAPVAAPSRPYRSLTWREHVEQALGHINVHLKRSARDRRDEPA